MDDAIVLNTAMVWGIEAKLIRLEIGLSHGLPGISVVGRPDSAVIEARQRVRCALKASGFTIPRHNVTINLAPADMRKSGTSFDLAIAVAILAATHQIPVEGLSSCLIIGELSLSGDICPVRGLLAFAELARKENLSMVAPQGYLPAGWDIHGWRFVRHLSEFSVPVAQAGIPAVGGCISETSATIDTEFGDVLGQEVAKLAISLAVAGGLGLFMVGPPGVGKTMLARCVPSIMPPLSDQEYHEIMLVRSIAGDLLHDLPVRQRPFRAPHHTSSQASMVGGGSPVHPGEITLAHHGVLFLDELGEFSRTTLQALRQPIEEGQVSIARVEGRYTFPCHFQLIAASNPCPCGHLGEKGGHCHCSEASIASYQSKMTGPLLDRMHLVVHLRRPTYTELSDRVHSSTSAELRERVIMAREFSRHRQSREQHNSSALTGHHGLMGVAQQASLDTNAQLLFADLLEDGAYSIRALAAGLRTARVIADMEESQRVNQDHLIEAMGYRHRGEVI